MNIDDLLMHHQSINENNSFVLHREEAFSYTFESRFIGDKSAGAILLS